MFAGVRKLFLTYKSSLVGKEIELHSVLKLFTGFAIAAFIDWKLTVISAIIIAVKPAKANTHYLICIL